MASIFSNLNRFVMLGAGAALAMFAGHAQAQPGAGTYASGLLHQPVGSAQLGPVSDRRLPVRNLGSSGQDGVEVQLNSAFGGGVAVDMGPFIAVAGGEIKIRHRGWDGMIYGTHRVVSNGDGSGYDTFDFSALGVTSMEVVDYDANGVAVSTQTIVGPIGEVPWVGQVIQCPAPCFWTRYTWWAIVNGKPHLASRGACVCPGDGDPTGGGHGYQNARVISPSFPAGAEPAGVAAMLVSAGGVPEFTVTATDLATFGVSSYGLGQAHISEECTNPVGCAPDERRLPVRNIGSTGQDGVEIKWPPATSVSYQCDGPASANDGTLASMTTAARFTKSSWTSPKSLRCTQTALPGGTTSMTFDTSDFGNVPILITTSVGGTPTGSGGGEPLGQVINTNTLDWILRHPWWYWNHLNTQMLRITNLGSSTGEPLMIQLVSNGMITSVPADTITIQVMTPGAPDAVTSVGFTGANLAGGEFSLGQLTSDPVVPRCVADVDDGSGSGTADGGVGIEDLLYYLGLYDAGSINADVDDGTSTGNPDGGVGIEDLLYYLARYDAGC